MATAATVDPTSGPTPVQIGSIPVILPELTYPNSTSEELQAVQALLAEPERDSNAQKARAVSKITLSPLTLNNLGTVRKLNSVSTTRSLAPCTAPCDSLISQKGR